MVMADRGTNSDRESVRVGLHGGPTRHLRDMPSATTTPQKARRMASGPKSKGGSKAGAPAVVSTSARRVVAQNLINMVAVMAGSGTVLLGLLAAKHFQIAQF
jgi:hypothetical protein